MPPHCSPPEMGSCGVGECAVRAAELAVATGGQTPRTWPQLMSAPYTEKRVVPYTVSDPQVCRSFHRQRSHRRLTLMS
jgi:hypothetical protein